MTTTASPVYSDSEAATTLVITGFNSLAASATVGLQLGAVSNLAAGKDAIDVFLQGFFTTGTTPTSGQVLEIWAGGSLDNSAFSAGGAAAIGALTPQNKKLLKLVDIIAVTGTSNQRYDCGPYSLANALGTLVLPPYWYIWFLNNTGAALHATAGFHTWKYLPFKIESA